MSFFTIEVQDGEVKSALQALQERLRNVGPVLREIGEDVVEDSKKRFETSSGPDGRPWAPNARATLEAMLDRRGGIGKSGRINKKGTALVMSKRPLIGESGDLRRQINYQVAGQSLTIAANPIYAAIQQFGGKKSEFPHLWGDIPARPFLPVKNDGALYPRDEEKIVATLNRWLSKS